MGNASQITSRVLIDTIDLGVVLVTVKGDSSGDVANIAVYTNTTASNPNPIWQIEEVQGVLANITSAHLAFDQTTPSVAQVLPGGYPFHFNYRVDSRCPIFNPAGTGTTGNLTLSTTGLSATQEGSFVVTFSKKRPSYTPQ